MIKKLSIYFFVDLSINCIFANKYQTFNVQRYDKNSTMN